MEIDFFQAGVTARSGAARRALLKRTEPLSLSSDYMGFGYDYFDNPNLGIGYGGYRYDGRYARAADAMCRHYQLRPGDRILEVGCAKGFVLVEFLKLGMRVAGIDLSTYALANAHPEVRPFVQYADACQLPYQDKVFSLVLCKEALPHIPEETLPRAVGECRRVSGGGIFFEIQCGRTELELERIRQWDGTHKAIRAPGWWDNLLEGQGYTGDVHYKVLFPGEDLSQD